MWGVRGSPKRVGGSELSDEGLMKTNPYGIIRLERQRLGVRFHEITLTPP